MNYFEEIAAGGCRTARCTTRSVQSMSLAVILMGTVNFDLEAVAEMRRKAALESGLEACGIAPLQSPH